VPDDEREREREREREAELAKDDGGASGRDGDVSTTNARGDDGGAGLLRRLGRVAICGRKRVEASVQTAGAKVSPGREQGAGRGAKV